MTCTEIIINGVVTFFAVVGAAWAGIIIYFRQKEYEIVKKRYLEGSVDVIASHLEESLGVMKHNWARCLNVVKAFRDQGADFDLKELEKGFLEFNASKFLTVENHRLQTLVNDRIYWDTFQSAMAFVLNSNSVIAHEITDVIRLKLTTDRIDRSVKEIVDVAYEQLNTINEMSHKYAYLTGQLNVIADLLEKEKLNFNKIFTFKIRSEVQSANNTLHEVFDSEFSVSDE